MKKYIVLLCIVVLYCISITMAEPRADIVTNHDKYINQDIPKNDYKNTDNDNNKGDDELRKPDEQSRDGITNNKKNNSKPESKMSVDSTNKGNITFRTKSHIERRYKMRSQMRMFTQKITGRIQQLTNILSKVGYDTKNLENISYALIESQSKINNFLEDEETNTQVLNKKIQEQRKLQKQQLLELRTELLNILAFIRNK